MEEDSQVMVHVIVLFQLVRSGAVKYTNNGFMSVLTLK